MKMNKIVTWTIREDGWSKIMGFAGNMQTPEGTLPVRGELEEFKRYSSLVSAGDRVVRHVEFRRASGGKLIKACWVFATCGYSLSHWDESPGGDLFHNWGMSPYIH